MNELQVKTIELEPAKVVFNYEEIEKDLEQNLQKYSGLTFTEDDATECRSTIAELRKGKKAVDQYRLKIKKELSVPVTEFENKCKALNKKFDEVISPLVEQSDAFEERRRNEKREQVEEIAAQIIEEFDLDEKHAVEMVIPDNYLTKSKSIKSIKEELETTAQHLKTKQEKEVADKELIKSTIEFINNRYGVNLSDSAYIRLLDFKDVKEIKTQILDDGQSEADKKIQQEKRKQEQLEREEKLKQEQLERESQEPIVPIQKDPEPVYEPVNIEQIPFSDVIPVETNETSVFEIYHVTGTESQLSALEKFMNENGMTWEVVTDE